MGTVACSEPDERMPWPTNQPQEEVAMPFETLGLWKSACFPLDDGFSRFFELQMKNDGQFVATERIHEGEGCKGLADEIRIRKGTVSEMESVGVQAWKFKASMDMEKQKILPGDLMKAEIFVKIIDGRVHMKPICADLFDLGDRIHKVWDDSDPVEWILEQLD